MHFSTPLTVSVLFLTSLATTSASAIALPVSNPNLDTRATAPQPNVNEYRQTTSKCPPAIAAAHTDSNINYGQCYAAVGGSYLSYDVKMPGAAPTACAIFYYTNNNCAGAGVCHRTPSGVETCVGNTGSATLSWMINCDASKTLNCAQG